jgi:Transposase DDE domain/Transposase domain (DUF772)
MARYKDVDSGLKLLAVDLSRQLLPGTFEHALSHWLDHELDLSHFDAHYRNDVAGSKAYPPGMLLKVVLFAYSQGIVSSRGMERACRDHVTFVSLSGDNVPHFTTLAAFVSEREQDEKGTEPGLDAKTQQRVMRLRREAAQLKDWLARHPTDRHGVKGSIRKSNRTDNESAKMATAKGVIQGYTGVAAVDAKHQVIVEAQAHGTASEQELLLPVVASMKDLLLPDSLLTVDSGYHSEKNLRALEDQGIDALIADNDMRQRDERFATQSRHQQGPDPLHDKSPAKNKLALYTPTDFRFDPQARTCFCPAGRSLYRQGKHCVTNKGLLSMRFQVSLRDCQPCPLRQRCLRTPETTKTRQVAFFYGKAPSASESATARMKRKIDSPDARRRYARRFATVEPVFANIRHNKRLNRFTLRGRRKVDAQWKLYCIVHNIEKLMNYGNMKWQQ